MGVNLEVEVEVNRRGRGRGRGRGEGRCEGIGRSKKRALDYQRAMNTRSGKMQRVVADKPVYVEELVASTEMDDESGVLENNVEVEDSVEDIEFNSDSDYAYESGSEYQGEEEEDDDDEAIGVIENRTKLFQMEGVDFPNSRCMEVEYELSGKEQLRVDVSPLIRNDANNAHLVHELDCQRTLQSMSTAKVERMNRMREEITKKRAELAESVKKILVEDGYKKEIPKDLKETLYDFSRTYEASAFRTVNTTKVYICKSYIQLMMEMVLSIPATEAVCERFFRYSSLFTKRHYVTNLKESTVRDYTYIKHYFNQLWRLLANNEQVNTVFGFFAVCLKERNYEGL